MESKFAGLIHLRNVIYRSVGRALDWQSGDSGSNPTGAASEFGQVHLPHIACVFHKGPFKCYVTVFSWEFYLHPPPHNANNVEPYTSVTIISRKADTHPRPTALRNT